jgi:hypothetical protein
LYLFKKIIDLTHLDWILNFLWLSCLLRIRLWGLTLSLSCIFLGCLLSFFLLSLFNSFLSQRLKLNRLIIWLFLSIHFLLALCRSILIILYVFEPRFRLFWTRILWILRPFYLELYRMIRALFWGWNWSWSLLKTRFSALSYFNCILRWLNFNFFCNSVSFIVEIALFINWMINDWETTTR